MQWELRLVQSLIIGTAPLRYHMGEEHTYDFVEGNIPCAAAPGELPQDCTIQPADPYLLTRNTGVDAISSRGDGFYSYFDKQSLESARQALDDLDTYVSREGPFDGVMAFSEGARAAATLLVHKMQQNPKQARRYPIFKCAVFFSGGVPGDPSALLRDEVRIMDYATDGEVIGIPTAHVYGLNDGTEPRIGIALAGLCNAKLRSVYVHSGGHEIPASRDREALFGTVSCVQRTIDKALFLQ